MRGVVGRQRIVPNCKLKRSLRFALQFENWMPTCKQYTRAQDNTRTSVGENKLRSSTRGNSILLSLSFVSKFVAEILLPRILSGVLCLLPFMSFLTCNFFTSSGGRAGPPSDSENFRFPPCCASHPGNLLLRFVPCLSSFALF